jgi:hypothetical protein
MRVHAGSYSSAMNLKDLKRSTRLHALHTTASSGGIRDFRAFVVGRNGVFAANTVSERLLRLQTSSTTRKRESFNDLSWHGNFQWKTERKQSSAHEPPARRCRILTVRGANFGLHSLLPFSHSQN